MLAKSFARIFFRNCVNVDRPALIVDTDKISEGDELETDLETGHIKNRTTGKEMDAPPLPPAMRPIASDGRLMVGSWSTSRSMEGWR